MTRPYLCFLRKVGNQYIAGTLKCSAGAISLSMEVICLLNILLSVECMKWKVEELKFPLIQVPPCNIFATTTLLAALPADTEANRVPNFEVLLKFSKERRLYLYFANSFRAVKSEYFQCIHIY